MRGIKIYIYFRVHLHCFALFFFFLLFYSLPVRISRCCAVDLDIMDIHQHPVHVHYLAGYIVLSYFISLVGCITTLELLHRRTSRSGVYNWYILAPSVTPAF